jgi:Ca-activated chloride channel family protein
MKSSVATAVAVSVLALGQTDVVAEQPIYRATTELVGLNVSVVDQHANPVAGLSADQFEVFEDGVKQELKFFAPGELPLDVVILLDTSASMTSSMPLIQQAASRFARSLRARDRAAVMGISDGLRVLQPFTNDLAALERAIQMTRRPAGRTPLYASIYTALRELEKLQRQPDAPRRQAMVVLSDGQDTSSTFTFDSLIEVVRRSIVPIYTIAPRPGAALKNLREQLYSETTTTADYELKKLAFETGALSFFPVNLVELTGVYDSIAQELAHQYSLGYQSTNQSKSGTFHRIAVRVDHPGLTWRARAGYVADREGNGW